MPVNHSPFTAFFSAAYHCAGKGRTLALALSLWLAAPVAGWSQAQQPVLDIVGDREAYAAASNAAVEAFTAGKWLEAAAGFEGVIKMILDPKAPQLPPLYYMAGASYFNGGDYGRAIDTFKLYLQKFPAAEKVLEIKLAMARAHLRAKKFEESIPLFKELEAIPAFRDEALLSQAQAHRELGKIPEAIAALEKLIAPDIVRVPQAGGAVTLAELYAEQKQSRKAVAILQKLEVKTDLIENPVGLNGLAVKLGDEFLEAGEFAEALAAYRTVRSKDDVLKILRGRTSRVEAFMEARRKAAVGNPQLLAEVEMANMQIKDALDALKKVLEEFQKLPDFGAALLLRMGRAYYEWQKRWESIVVHQRLLDRYPEGKEQAKEREAALFGQVVAYADLLQPKRCQKTCEQYLKEFKDGPNVGTVGYLSGAVALQVQDFAGAEAAFESMLEKVPNSPYKEEMRFLLGNAKFMQGKIAPALKEYLKYQADHPNGERSEEVVYRIGLSNVFLAEYGKAAEVLGDFVKKFPQSPLTPDARYRLMICQYAGQKYPEVIAAGEAWVREYPEHQQEGEIQALLGDCFAAESRLPEAITAYQRAYKIANTDEILNYALFETSKHLQKLGKWAEVAKMFEDFVKEKPDHQAVISAMFWIGKAKAKQGQIEEAKVFLVENLKKYIAEPKREAVEPLLQQLAQLCAKRPRPKTPPPAPATPAPAPAAKDAPPATPAPTPPPPPPLPPWDAYGELARLVAPLEADANTTTKARLLYAKSVLAREIRKPEEADAIYAEMSVRFKPEDLSPFLLAHLGDFLIFRGDHERAAVFFERLKEDFPKSDYLDFAYSGLGEIALAKKEYEKALDLFTDAIDKIGASSKMKEATIGKAHALFALKRYGEAKKLFEQVASVREWRGESTAMAVYWLGRIEAEEGRYAEAIAFYRRVFVAYQKHLPWVARSYLGAAATFEKMHQPQDAIANLKDMLRNPKLDKLPEAEQARRRLVEMGSDLSL